MLFSLNTFSLTLNDNLLRYYSMTDASDMTNYNVNFVTGGLIGNRAEFLQSTYNYLKTPIQLNSTNGFTIAGYLYMNENNGDYNPIYSQRLDWTNMDFEFYVYEAAAPYVYRLWLGGSAAQQISFTLPVTYNAWSFVALSFDFNANTVTLYVDGQSETVSLTTGWTSSTTMSYGLLGEDLSTTSTYVYKGYMDEQYIYNRALTTAELDELKQRIDNGESYPFNINQDYVDLTDYWLYSSLDNIIASGQLSVEGKVSGYISFSQTKMDEGGLWINDIDNKSFVIGRDVYDYLQLVPNETFTNPLASGNSKTIDFYFNNYNSTLPGYTIYDLWKNDGTQESASDTKGGGILTLGYQSGTFRNIGLYLTAGTTNYLRLAFEENANTELGYIQCNDPLTAGRHRITLWFNSDVDLDVTDAGNKIKIFIDGNECSGYTTSGSFSGGYDSSQLKIGFLDTYASSTYTDLDYLAGEYDELCVWDKALNTTELNSLNYYRSQGRTCNEFVSNIKINVLNKTNSLINENITFINITNQTNVEEYNTTTGTLYINHTISDTNLYNITITNPYYYTLKLYNFNFSNNSSILNFYLDEKLRPKILVEDFNIKELEEKKVFVNFTFNNEVYSFIDYNIQNNSLEYNVISQTESVNGDNTTIILEFNVSYKKILEEEFLDTLNITANFKDLITNNTISKKSVVNVSLQYYYTIYNFEVNPILSIYNMYTNLSYNYYNDGKVNVYCYYNKSTDSNLISGSNNFYNKKCVFDNNIITTTNTNHNINLYPVLAIEYNNNTYYRTNNSYITQQNKYFNIITDTGTSTVSGYYEVLRINLYDEDIYPGLTYNYSYYYNPWTFKVIGTKNVYKTVSYNNNRNVKTPIYRLLVTPTFVKLKNNGTLNFEYNSYYNVNDKTYTRYYWVEDGCMIVDNSSSKIVSVYPIGTETYSYPQNLINVNLVVKDNAGNPISDAIVKVMRQKNDGSFYLDEKTKTNENGEASAKLIAYDEIYYFIIQKNCKEIYRTTTTNIISNTLNINVQDTGGVVYNSIINSLDYTLFYDNVSKTENLNYSSVGGLSGDLCLKIVVNGYPSERTINSSCLNTENGNIILSKPENYGKYNVIVTYNNQIIAKEVRDFGSYNPTFEGSGTMLYLIFTLIILGLSVGFGNPYIFLVLHPALTFVVGSIGMINITYYTTITYIIISLGVLYYLKRRGGYY